ncbi:hypothetical protein AMAG_03050 [Allomyces macrogynus ATCC 38327]|uniref:Small ribosomal subunit protein mS41 n=1 Tax=Allomyces macrogynus (strain ATCC 38327) TaxID=578462 RepID=A0A0L0S459_ALLM3|nr:hypothetical protein AMAG_03050 [Allomyces macrogynus ATCC 38327]|eukprot:KNE57328.1 hypothetical protein AMAG_03050 [Allomyces macrogynus ATCC 38327]
MIPALRLGARQFSTSVVKSAQVARPVPPPKGDVKDVKSFLYYIGRNMEPLASKIPSWDAMFTMDTHALKSLGLNPRQRKYLLLWAERYRQGRELSVIKNSGKRK